MRKAAIPCLIAATALALGACSSGSASGGDGAKSGETQTVTIWGPWSGADQDKAQKMFDAYNASQKNYKVEYQPQEEIGQKVLTALASGSVPDVVIWDRYQTALYAGKGALEPLDERLKTAGKDTSVFYPQSVEEVSYEGKTYGLPLLVDNRSLFYNKKMFAEAGLKPPTTWDELRDAAVKLTKRDSSGKLVQSGFELKDAGLFNFWCFQAGCELVTEDQQKTAFNSAGGKAVLDFWGELLTKDKVYDLGFSDGSDPFAEGRLAMKYDGPWALATLDEVEGLDYGVVEPVAGPSGTKASMMGGLSLVIPKGAKSADGAWDFMSWWTLDPKQGIEFAKISNWPPANSEAAKDPYFDSEKFAAFIAAMDYAHIRPSAPGFGDVERLALTPAIQKFMSGELAAGKALADAATQGDDILAKESAG